MTVRDFFERYGVALGVVAVLMLVIAVLPGNAQDRAGVDASLGRGLDPLESDLGDGLGVEDALGGDIGGDVAVDGGGGIDGATDGDAGPSGPVDEGGQGPVGGPDAPPPASTVQFGTGPDCDSNGRQKGVSGYMPPCVQWNGGDNGGATARGVTGSTIKVAIWQGQEDPATRQVLAGAKLNDTPPVVDRMYKSLRHYFNNHYQTYGREVVFETITASGESTSDAAMKADAVKIADEMGAFAVFTGNALAPMPTVLASELARRGVLCICTTSLSSQFYQEHPPLIWSSLPTINEYAAHSAEYAAKRLGRNNAAFAGPLIRNQKRVYCLMILVGTGTTISPEGPRGRDIVVDAYQKRGLTFAKVVQYFYAPGQNQDDITNMIGQLKSAKCTTIVPVVDPIMPILITKEATKQAYFPEWYVMGTGLSDTTTIARFYDQQQWEHAFGVSPLWVTWDRVENSAGYHEYHHGVGGSGRKGDEGALINVYRASFQTLWTGIHMAGPNLNNETFERGMYAYPKTGGNPANPLVFRNRAFPTEVKDFSEIYYDPKLVGPDERSETGAGMIVRVDAGKRYDAGEWPQSPPSRANAVTVTAQQGNNVNHAADGHKHDKKCLSCSG
ncbi:ABC transporter substrate-binding protein [Actinospongicola halichondriae]|uniref:ABC transporter substrate-binding protein n=1 Tax=Actinospongicola halichondriae TaxID=3236844 RepID=UPI003D3E32F1